MVWRTLFSVSVCSTSFFWKTKFFLRIFMAYILLEVFSRHRTTLPKAPRPRTLRSSKSSMATLFSLFPATSCSSLITAMAGSTMGEAPGRPFLENRRRNQDLNSLNVKLNQ